MSLDQSDYVSLRAGRRENLRDIVPLPAPFSVYVEPTNICNFKCSYCPVHLDDYAERSGGLGKLTLEACSRIYDEILTLGRLRTLNLYMLGEPFANRSLPDFIKLAKQKDVADRVIVTSNATLIDEAMALRTIESGLDYLRVSIYGVSDGQLQAVAGTKIPAERIISNVARLKRLRDERGSKTPFIYAKMIETADRESNERFLDMFRPITDQVEIEPPMNWNMSEDEVDFSGFGKELHDHGYFARKKNACPFPFYTLVVNSDLRVTVCCVDWEKATQVGDLRTQSLKEIWHGEALNAFRLKHLRGERHTLAACRSCTFLHTTPDNLDDLAPETFARRVA
jgi:MoaA/NifB/PqqE/SkfB family radical SAM enzyme